MADETTPPKSPQASAARSPLEMDLDRREHAEVIPPIDADAFEQAQHQDREEGVGGKRRLGTGETQSPLEADRAAAGKPPAEEQADETPTDTEESGAKPKIGLRKLGTREREIHRAEDWKAVKAERDKWRAEAEALRARPAAAESPEELVKLKAERDQYRDLVRQAAIERDPDFNREFTTRRKVAIDQAKMAAGGKSDEIGKLLEQPASQWRDGQLDTLLADMPAASQRRLNAALAVLDQIDIDRTSRIEQARVTWDSRQAANLEQQNKQVAERQQDMNRTFESILSEYQRPGDGGIFFYQAKEGDEAHNRGIAESVQIAKDLLAGKLDKEDMVRGALIVGASERLFRQMETMEADNQALRKQIKKLRGVDPGAGGRTSLAESGRGSKPPMYGQPGDRDYFDQEFEAAQRADRKGKWD